MLEKAGQCVCSILRLIDVGHTAHDVNAIAVGYDRVSQRIFWKLDRQQNRLKMDALERIREHCKQRVLPYYTPQLAFTQGIAETISRSLG